MIVIIKEIRFPDYSLFDPQGLGILTIILVQEETGKEDLGSLIAPLINKLSWSSGKPDLTL